MEFADPKLDSTLEATYRKQERGWTRKDKEEDGMVIIREDSPFHVIKFHRVILDEAHCIKVRLTISCPFYVFTSPPLSL